MLSCGSKRPSPSDDHQSPQKAKKVSLESASQKKMWEKARFNHGHKQRLARTEQLMAKLSVLPVGHAALYEQQPSTDV